MTPPPPPFIPTSFDDFSKQFIKGFDQMKQFAAESIGKADVITEYPHDYTQLDEKVDKVKTVFDGLLRVTRQLLTSDDYNPQIQETIYDAMDKINVKLERLRTNGNNDVNLPQTPRHPSTLQEATAEICLQGADILATSFENLSNQGSDLPAADLLQRYGQIQLKLAEIRSEFNSTITRKFIEPFSTYVGAYENANRARRNAQRVRLDLDSVKSKVKNQGSSSRSSELYSKVETLEREFSSACEEAVQEMTLFIQYTEATHCIETLIQAQQVYHRKAAEILASLN